MRNPTLSNIESLASFCTILHQETNQITTMKLTDPQKKWISLLINSDRSIAIKSRQTFFTTATILYLFALCLINVRISTAIVVDTHDKSKAIIARIRQWCTDLGLKLEKDSATSIVLPNGSRIDALSAGASLGTDARVGRSGTYSAIILSEFSYYSNREAVLASISSSLTKKGKLIIETTLSAGDTTTKSLWLANNTYSKLFVSFQDHPTYQLDPSSISNEDFLFLSSTYGITSRSHAAFWWSKLNNDFAGDINRILREYPVVPEHSWTAATCRFITVDPLLATYSYLDDIKIIEKKRSDSHYIISVDTAIGSGGDNSCIIVFNTVTNKIAATWYRNDKPIDYLVDKIKILQNLYQPKGTYVEDNGVSYATVALARKQNLNIIPFTTTQDLKYQFLLFTKKYVETGNLAVEELQEECLSLHVDYKNGSEKFKGKKDFSMALGMSLYFKDRWKDTPLAKPVHQSNQFNMDKALEAEAKRRKRGY